MALEYEDFVNALTEETTPDNAADFLVIVDTSGSDVNKVKPSSILGTDLSAIRALTPTNDDVLQRKAGAWTNRTIAQLKADLGVSGTNTGDQNTFGTVAVSGQSNVVADAANDTLTLAAGAGIAITTDASTDTVTVASTVTGNATHTGEVTGATALTVDKTAITNKTLVNAAVGDHVLIADASDSDNLKKVTVQTIVDLAGGGASIGGTVTSATAGSVFFAGAAGVLAQDNAGFFYDDANNQLKLTASAATQTPIQINLANAHSANALEVKNSGGTTIASIDKDGIVTANAFIGTNGGINVFQAFSGYFMGVGSGSLYFRTGGSYEFTDTGANILFKVDGNTTAGNTRMLVWDVDNGQLERVSVGAADSGGVGYKVLRIPN